MIKFDIDEKDLLVEIHPNGSLQEEDFTSLTVAVDSLIEEKGDLSGLLIETEKFPGWGNIGAMVKHFKFVKDHHRKIKKVAMVTDAKCGNVAETFMSHFVAAEIKQFPSGDTQSARSWIISE